MEGEDTCIHGEYREFDGFEDQGVNKLEPEEELVRFSFRYGSQGNAGCTFWKLAYSR